MTVSKRTGIIGGSGLYAMQGIEVLDELDMNTPWGKPSAPLVLAHYHGQEIVFLPRHGAGHSIPPHKINYRANVYALKQAGVSRVISISAVGSLREHIAPGDFVLVDQFVDRTINREKTFFDGPVVAHVCLWLTLFALVYSNLYLMPQNKLVLLPTKMVHIWSCKDRNFQRGQSPHFIALGV